MSNKKQINHLFRVSNETKPLFLIHCLIVYIYALLSQLFNDNDIVEHRPTTLPQRNSQVADI